MGGAPSCKFLDSEYPVASLTANQNVIVFIKGDDDVENYTEDWVTSPLVGWGWWPTTGNSRAYRDLVYGKWPNDATAAPQFWGR
ncbi:hypothetical protein BHE90_009690 [Fusarium euwallaceae]|uniref:Uncharacterized protein n=1 Tax=Fusarium euwallaceae TaxID=1147111 RepID=A0A430LJJ2_9HYPO|nr:hypothetical protein BHE90_009690 [Fusarium euwallaceae]